MSAKSEVSLLPLGAIIQEFKVAGLNIVQGFPTQEQYTKYNGPYFGETIGRVANRTKDAKFSLNNQNYTLAANNGPNNLHGGVVGWGKRIWEGPKPVGLRKLPGIEGLDGGESVEFTLKSEDGDEGFPGEVLVKVIYTTGLQKSDQGEDMTVLGMEYEAELVSGAEETVINMTNHSYFNLSGQPTIEGTEVQLCTPSYLPVDSDGIPTSGPKDFPNVTTNSQFTLGPTDPDIDDCFVVDAAASPSSVPIDTRSLPLTRLISAYHPKTHVNLEVLSTEPAFQFYTGKYIDVPAVDGAPARAARSGFCVEPSRFVNAINEPEWKGQVVLKKGEKYGARIVYRGWEGKRN